MIEVVFVFEFVFTFDIIADDGDDADIPSDELCVVVVFVVVVIFIFGGGVVFNDFGLLLLLLIFVLADNGGVLYFGCFANDTHCCNFGVGGFID